MVHQSPGHARGSPGRRPPQGAACGLRGRGAPSGILLHAAAAGALAAKGEGVRPALRALGPPGRHRGRGLGRREIRGSNRTRLLAVRAATGEREIDPRHPSRGDRGPQDPPEASEPRAEPSHRQARNASEGLLRPRKAFLAWAIQGLHGRVATAMAMTIRDRQAWTRRCANRGAEDLRRDALRRQGPATTATATASRQGGGRTAGSSASRAGRAGGSTAAATRGRRSVRSQAALSHLATAPVPQDLERYLPVCPRLQHRSAAPRRPPGAACAGRRALRRRRGAGRPLGASNRPRVRSRPAPAVIFLRA